jgi:predicted porin
MTFGGLSLGQPYLFQWWANNARNTPVVVSATATATNSVTLDTNLTDTDGGLGQFVTGTFTADGTTQEIVLTGVGVANPIINAFQIRAVPEPATCVLALAGLACGGYSMWRRRGRG